MNMLERVQARVSDIDGDLAAELIKTATDRILLKVGTGQTLLPAELESIAVEVVVAMYNRHTMRNEGVQSESVDAFSVSFIQNLLKEYEEEFANYRRLYQTQQNEKSGKVRFL